MNELKEYTERLFEDIKHIDENGCETNLKLKKAIVQKSNAIIGFVQQKRFTVFIWLLTLEQC